MAPARFNVVEHVIPGQHIREYHHAVKTGADDTLRLSVKQYTPKSPPSTPTRFPAITVLAGHALGFPKELLEPMWDDFLDALRAQGGDIRAIWFPEVVHHGASALLNEDILGDDTHWFDHSRDMLHMVNHFRDQMERPLIGIAHSLGCAQLVHLSIMHPRLMASMILIEPVIMPVAPLGPNAALVATARPDLWPSRAAAETALRSSRALRNWDPRAVAAYAAHAFRATPTPLHPAAPPGSVTLATSKHQEAWSYVRPNFEPAGDADVDRRLEPDLWAAAEGTLLSFRPEYKLAFAELPAVRPLVCWVFGAKSPFSPPAWRAAKMDTTGTGVGGSGGAAAGRVAHVTFDDSGHFVLCERPRDVAVRMAGWLTETALPSFAADEAWWRAYRSRKSARGAMLEVSDEWRDMVRRPTSEVRVAVKVSRPPKPSL